MKGTDDPRTAVLDGDFVDWDYGFDFYAPQTFQTRDGRRILFGWAGMADADAEYTVPTKAAEGWQHLLTVPREVTLHAGPAVPESRSGAGRNAPEAASLHRRGNRPSCPIRCSIWRSAA